jgi:hypothetical protein
VAQKRLFLKFNDNGGIINTDIKQPNVHLSYPVSPKQNVTEKTGKGKDVHAGKSIWEGHHQFCCYVHAFKSHPTSFPHYIHHKTSSGIVTKITNLHQFYINHCNEICLH